MKILCVAEKPSIARSISEILAGGNGLNNRPGKDKYCRNYEFEYNMPAGRNFGARSGGGGGGLVEMVVTSVRGHLMSSDFPESYRKWNACSPSELFTAPIEVDVSKDAKQVAQNLKAEVRRADVLMIWTDCDREGEHIGSEVVKICRQVNPRVEVKRARFSAIIANQIHRAAQNPVELDWRAAEAVESRMELDLRLGAAFTRLQCLSLQAQNVELQKRVISYGPCQFPTLGFVVDRYIVARDFIPEAFWYIAVKDKRSNMEVDFRWSRNHLMDQQAVRVIYQRCRASPEATVVKVTSKSTRKFKPSPLTTVELQKSGGRLLRMAPKKVLDIAERLYQRGILSYPRTETDQYDKAFDFRSLIAKHTNDASWGSFAARLTDAHGEGEFERPINGRKNDQAHPPIHPTRHASDLNGDEKRVYEYITRRFLASCHKHAVGNQTTVDLDIAKELFTASGVVVVEQNYLEVYTYDKWGGPALPLYRQGERFVPFKMEMKEGETSRPKLLTEADLVSLMDRNGIGTDATIAEHISKIIEREYVKLLKEGQINYLIPSELGMGLVEGYNAIEFDGNKSLCKPLLRRETEERMALICQGAKTKEETVQQSLQEYRAVFDKTRAEIGKLIDRVGANLRGEYAQGNGHTDADASTGTGNHAMGGGGGSASVGPAIEVRVREEESEGEEVEEEVLLYAPPQPAAARAGRGSAASGRTTTDPRRTMAINTSRRADSSSTSPVLTSTTLGLNNNTMTASTGRTTPASTASRSNISNVCFTCGEGGHWSHECPTRQQAMRGSDRGRQSDQACFTCGQRGHWASDCTEAAGEGGRATKRARGATNGRGLSGRGRSSRGQGRR